MDLEMTGLSPDLHVIVEIATIVTDNDLEVVAEGPDLVITQPPSALENMPPVVAEMHRKSGLLDAIAVSTTSLDEAAAQTLDFLKRHIPDLKGTPLCGNSIGTDRRFLAKYMPQIEDGLHYRCVDVSSIKELVRRWYPEIYKATPMKAAGHRALDDIRESIRELRFYHEQVFTRR